jgi:hypothetical protein
MKAVTHLCQHGIQVGKLPGYLMPVEGYEPGKLFGEGAGDFG